MLTEESIVDKIEVVSEYKIIQVRTATIIKKDGFEISRSYHRHLVQPGQDVSDEDETVAAIAKALHTPELIAAFEKKREEDLAFAKLNAE